MIFPADPETDLAAIIDGTPSLSRFAALLREHGFSPFSASPSSSASPASSVSSVSPSPLGEKAGAGNGGRGSGGNGGRRANDEGGERGVEVEGARRLGTRKKFTTVFAPTNYALDRLERERPWLFQELEGGRGGVAGVNEGEGGDGVGNADGGGRAASGEGGGWVPIRELLAYHLIPGEALFSR